jgi:hypothetical protein
MLGSNRVFVRLQIWGGTVLVVSHPIGNGSLWGRACAVNGNPGDLE